MESVKHYCLMLVPSGNISNYDNNDSTMTMTKHVLQAKELFLRILTIATPGLNILLNLSPRNLIYKIS